MNVTKNNFVECLPHIQNAIDSADFITIDGEFTGLRNGVEVTAYDTPAEYYKKLRDGSLNFLLIQVGICTFKFDPVKEIYVYKAFNFYVFPKPLNKIGSDVNFLCQASSINFLCNSGFDFNKLFREGIPYLTIAEEESLENDLRNRYDNQNDVEPCTKIPIPDALTSVIEDICKKIETFLLPENAEKELYIEKCNGFVRKLVYQTAYERFSTKNFMLITKRIDENVFLVAQKGKPKAEIVKENFEKDQRELKEAVGFSKIIRYISDKKKPIIGHNMLLDICHIISRFCWPLPENYEEFKDMVHQLFPSLVDTKYMCSAFPFRDLIPSSVMDHMFKQLHEPPFRFPKTEPEAMEFSYPENEEKSHEAGYDAYITGLAFIALATYLSTTAKKPSKKIDMELLKPYQNRLFLMRIMDYSFINLKGEEPKPKRDHVFYVTFPKEWKTTDIVHLFSPYGNIHVSYCNQTTAWVTLLEPEKAELAVSGLIKTNLQTPIGTCKPYSVLTWSMFERNERVASANLSRSRVINKVNESPIRNETAIISSPSSTINREEVKLSENSSKKRSSEPEESSRQKKKKKRVKNTEQEQAESISLGKLSSSHLSQSPKILSSPGKARTSIACRTDLILDHLCSDKTEIRKTFEEPTWE